MARVDSHNCMFDKENPAVAVLALVFKGNIGRLRREHNECHETTCGSYGSFGSKTQLVGSFVASTVKVNMLLPPKRA